MKRGAQVYPRELWEDWRRAYGKNGMRRAPQSAPFVGESAWRHKKSGREENEMFSAPYSGFSGVVSDSEVKHLTDLFITHTAGKFSTMPSGHQRSVTAGGDRFQDNDGRNVVVSWVEVALRHHGGGIKG